MRVSSCEDHHNLPYDSPHLEKTCIRQVVLDKWFPLRTNGVNTNGAAAKVMSFVRLGKKVRPGTFGNIEVGKREYPKGPSVKTHDIYNDPLVLIPFLPFRGPGGSTPRGGAAA